MAGANDKSVINLYKVTLEELPLYCPRTAELWDKHPRVFLPIEAEGEATCPYCGCHYKLVTTID